MTRRNIIKPKASVESPEKKARREKLLARLQACEEHQERWQSKLKRAFNECDKMRQTIKRLNAELRKLEQ
jgi:hypothetical protein